MKLFSYDHCPYCVKARMIFGYKNIPFELITLLNDDVATPTSMIGKKMLPILELDDGSFMAESMDIIHYIDNSYGDVIIGNIKQNWIDEWLENTRQYVYNLAMPRWVNSPLDEFATEGAKAFFTEKKEAMIGDFSSNLANTSSYIKIANNHLKILDSKLMLNKFNNDKIFEHDFHIFAILRSLSIVDEIIFPHNILVYMQQLSDRTNIPLHFDIAS